MQRDQRDESEGTPALSTKCSSHRTCCSTHCLRNRAITKLRGSSDALCRADAQYRLIYHGTTPSPEEARSRNKERRSQASNDYQSTLSDARECLTAAFRFRSVTIGGDQNLAGAISARTLSIWWSSSHCAMVKPDRRSVSLTSSLRCVAITDKQSGHNYTRPYCQLVAVLIFSNV